jgi:hypothetical protein
MWSPAEWVAPRQDCQGKEADRELASQVDKRLCRPRVSLPNIQGTACALDQLLHLQQTDPIAA